jgi:DNA-binding NtrC family response regulator
MRDPIRNIVVVSSPRMRSVFERIDVIAPTDTTVLLIGETGAGKELLAEYVHRTSRRSQKPFVKVGLAALPPELLESELFGHEKGAFTSALSGKKGLFELADTGTIFLDDIDDFPMTLQVKLLRVLESAELMRVGGVDTIPIDVRVICASKTDLRPLVEQERFRADLFYRINVVPVYIPPLRERQDDIPLLVEYFLTRYAGGKRITVDTEAMRLLRSYSWPGNVRELRNIVQRMSVFTNGSIGVADLPPEVRDETAISSMLASCTRCFSAGDRSLDDMLSCLERNMLRSALQRCGGNRTQAARYLKLSLSTFRDRLHKHQLDAEAGHDDSI